MIATTAPATPEIIPFLACGIEDKETELHFKLPTSNFYCISQQKTVIYPAVARKWPMALAHRF